MNERGKEPVGSGSTQAPVFSSPWAALFAHLRANLGQVPLSRS